MKLYRQLSAVSESTGRWPPSVSRNATKRHFHFINRVNSGLFLFRQVLAMKSALTGNAPTTANHSRDSVDATSEAIEEAEKDRRRLDTDNDLLEEFLENEGKILRLPTSGDSGNIDIDALTKVYS